MRDASVMRGTRPPSNTISQLHSTADTYSKVQQTFVLKDAPKYAFDINTLAFNSTAFGTSKDSTTLNPLMNSSVS